MAASLSEAPGAAQPGLGEELRALALISLGITEYWTARFGESTQHLDRGQLLAARTGRPYLEFSGLACQATAEFFQSFAVAAEHSGRPSSWPRGTAGPTIRPPASFARRSDWCWPGRKDWSVLSPGSRGPNAL